MNKNELIGKYQIQKNTINELIEKTNQNNIDKFTTVNRFISSFIYDLKQLK